MPDEPLIGRKARAKVDTDFDCERIELFPGVSVAGINVPRVVATIAVDELDGSIKLGLATGEGEGEGEGGAEVEAERITPDRDTPNSKPCKIELGPIDIDVSLEADHAAGEIKATGVITAPIIGKVTEINETLYYSPAHGFVGDDDKPHPPRFDDPQFGQSRMSSKNVTRIFVDDRERLVADVGRVCKRALWPDKPDWVFNTVACVGPHDDEGRGSYSDPTSPWFNVFLGYYQIDAPKSGPDGEAGWDRPFGYKDAEGPASDVDFEEVVRLGKSDWNYFSNWMYGVPNAQAEVFDPVELEGVSQSQTNEGVGEGSWHRVKIGAVEFVSAYESDEPGAKKLVSNSLVSGLWRKAFGKPNPKPSHRESFIGAALDADIYMAYWEDDEAFHTLIFGGTAATGSDPSFLEGQMAAAREVIETHYPRLGFTPG